MISSSKIMETYFGKDYNTSWVIGILEEKHNDVYSFGALKLYRVFHLKMTNVDDPNQYGCFAVSLYIKRDEDCEVEALDSKLTLSKMKKLYAEEYFLWEEAEKDEFLSMILKEIAHLDWNQHEQDIIFSKSIKFKAQGIVYGYDKAKTRTYHIVGVGLEKVR